MYTLYTVSGILWAGSSGSLVPRHLIVFNFRALLFCIITQGPLGRSYHGSMKVRTWLCLLAAPIARWRRRRILVLLFLSAPRSLAEKEEADSRMTVTRPLINRGSPDQREADWGYPPFSIPTVSVAGGSNSMSL